MKTVFQPPMMDKGVDSNIVCQCCPFHHIYHTANQSMCKICENNHEGD